MIVNVAHYTHMIDVTEIFLIKGINFILTIENLIWKVCIIGNASWGRCMQESLWFMSLIFSWIFLTINIESLSPIFWVNHNRFWYNIDIELLFAHFLIFHCYFVLIGIFDSFSGEWDSCVGWDLFFWRLLLGLCHDPNTFHLHRIFFWEAAHIH
jgi:hypothetical protein